MSVICAAKPNGHFDQRDLVVRWLPNQLCTECDQPLAIVPVRYSDNSLVEKVCLSCGLSKEVERVQVLGVEVYGRGPVHHLVFGKNLGTIGGMDRQRQFLTVLNRADGAVQRTSPEAAREFWRRKRELENLLQPGQEPLLITSSLEVLSHRIKEVENARGIKIPETIADNVAKLLRKGIRQTGMKKLSKKARVAIVEGILREEGYWPPL